MNEIEEKIKNSLPKEFVKEIAFEGAEIIIYTTNEEFFKNPFEYIKDLISQLKRRIEVRIYPTLCKDKNYTIEIIKNIIPKESNLKDIVFEESRSLVIIEVENSSIAIGKDGENIKKIKNETFWTPKVERVPSIPSALIPNVRKFIHEEENFRKKFLQKIGEKILVVKPSKKYWIRITFLGGAREVGRSCLLVETPQSNILIDCGIKAGIYNENGFPILNVKEFDLNSIDGLILSHAHLDHAGFIPYLYELGLDAPIYMTEPTLDIYTLLITDFLDVMQKNAINPIFGVKGLKESLKRVITLEYNEVTDITNDVKLTFQNAGHIIGSSIIHLHIGDGLHNIIYALDQKFDKTTLLDPAFTNFKRVETLIIESTYGAKEDVMPKRKESEKELINIINETMKNNGIVLIPSFAVERAQDIMAILARENFEYPVFIDGMIWDATSIYTIYPEYLGKHGRKLILKDKIFNKDIFRRVSTKSEREKILEERPAVIISTSGMLTGGPSIEYFKRLCEDERNVLLFVGFQAQGTLGRKILEGSKEIQLEDDGNFRTFKVNMQIKYLKGLSGHSDRRQLLAYVNNLAFKPKRIFVVHGEESKTISLANTYQKIFGIESYAPRNLETLRIL
ncbi:MAG: beta-CASP ribonuclease aCPSF1 [Candidatus Aenigmatarchaeota archaeon]